jgi:EAL domain-containing protein (putative c-di-GMP-specific phosphodiesterase class I)
VARRIQADLETPFVLGEHELYTTVSVGIAASTPEHETAQDVLRDADVAMFRAKELGRARAVAFDRSMHDHAVATLHLENDLRRALEREEFVLHYQPIVDLNSHRLEGFEALIRWAHPVRGLLQPQDFLRSADDTGLIVPMGSWVLREVCRQIAEWGLGLNAHRPIRIHVNVSAHQLSGAGLVDRVAAALEEAGIPGRLLHLELTESTMMQNAEAAVVTLKRLKELDVGLAIDDFGTGYSSLSYLHRFPTDSVKIDRSFVSRMGALGGDSGIVRTIVDLAHDLGMEVVAEGIETEPQAAMLRGMRCALGQGFLFSRALPPDEARRVMEAGPSW